MTVFRSEDNTTFAWPRLLVLLLVGVVMGSFMALRCTLIDGKLVNLHGALLGIASCVVEHNATEITELMRIPTLGRVGLCSLVIQTPDAIVLLSGLGDRKDKSASTNVTSHSLRNKSVSMAL